MRAIIEYVESNPYIIYTKLSNEGFDKHVLAGNGHAGVWVQGRKNGRG